MSLRPLRHATALLFAVIALAPPFADGAPRIAPLVAAQSDEAQRAISARFAALGMRNAIATYARYPALANAMLPYTEFLLTKSTLPPRHRELLWLRTAWLARSDYVWAQRAPMARSAGVTDAELTRIARGPDAPGWEPFEAALLRSVDELRVDSFVSDATWTALDARYDANQLVDLVYGVGEIAMHATFASTLRFEIEPELKDRLPAGIAYAPAARQVDARLQGKAPRLGPVSPPGQGLLASNVFRTFATNPPADELRNAVGSHIRGSNSLLPRHRQQVVMRIGVLTRSEYEWAAQSRGGRNAGMTDADIARVIAGPAAPGLTALEAALLQAADELYRDDAVADATWDVLAKELTEQQLFDVLFSFGGYRSASWAINSAGVQLDANMAEFRFPPELR